MGKMGLGFGPAVGWGWIGLLSLAWLGAAEGGLRAQPMNERAPEGQMPVPASSPMGTRPAATLGGIVELETDGGTVLGGGELSLEALLREVLARNLSVAEMTAAWQAAAARYPQVRSPEDPMLGASLGPETISPDDRGVRFAYRLEVSQKIPFPGKLRLRGEQALAEADAAGRDIEDTRLQLVESTRAAYFDYHLADRALAVNDESLRLLREFRENARGRYRTGLVPEQDVLQAEVEIGREQERRLELEQLRQIAVARLNTLLHLPADGSLPPPPARMRPAGEVPDVRALRAAALARRPDLHALAARLAAEQAGLALANKEFCPDFEPFFMYDRFMGNAPENRDLASMVGVRLNLPIYRSKRLAAVAEAEARVARRQAELARRRDQVGLEVQEAYARVSKSERSVALYQDVILPAAVANVKAAQAAYLTGKTSFLALVEAQRNVAGLRERYYEAVADSFRRRAELERAVGGPMEGIGPTVCPRK